MIVVLITDDPGQALYSIPIMSVAFLCHFNVLPLHSELQRPTRQRIKAMVHLVVGTCLVLYLVIGVFGCLFSLDETKGNILNNFAADDPLINIGRAGLALTVVFSTPLLVVPCRKTLERCYALAFTDEGATDDTHWWKQQRRSLMAAAGKDYGSLNNQSAEALDVIDEGFVDDFPTQTTATDDDDDNNDDDDDDEFYDARDIGDVGGEGQQGGEAAAAVDAVTASFGVIFAETALILGSATVLAVYVPDVAIVWSVMGSTVSILLVYVLPPAFYLRIRARKAFNIRKAAAWAMLAFGLVAEVFCSWQAFNSLSMPKHMDLPTPNADGEPLA